MFTYLFHSFGLAAVPMEILYKKISWLGSPGFLLCYNINIARNMIKFFIFISRLTKTEVLMCTYVDVGSSRYSYKIMLQNFASNLHKRIPAGAFPHKSDAFSFLCTTHCATCFQLHNCKRMFQVACIPQ